MAYDPFGKRLSKDSVFSTLILQEAGSKRTVKPNPIKSWTDKWTFLRNNTTKKPNQVNTPIVRLN